MYRNHQGTKLWAIIGEFVFSHNYPGMICTKQKHTSNMKYNKTSQPLIHLELRWNVCYAENENRTALITRIIYDIEAPKVKMNVSVSENMSVLLRSHHLTPQLFTVQDTYTNKYRPALCGY